VPYLASRSAEDDLLATPVFTAIGNPI